MTAGIWKPNKGVECPACPTGGKHSSTLGIQPPVSPQAYPSVAFCRDQPLPPTLQSHT